MFRLTITLFFFFSFTNGEIENCTKQHQNLCIECASGSSLFITDKVDEYGIPIIECKLDDVIENCQTSSSGNDGVAVCIKCVDGYYLDSTGKCNKCSLNCALCDSLHCYSCVNNTFLSLDRSKCVLCNETATQEECGICETKKYFNVTTKKCESCIDNCELCTTSTNCFSCSDKYYFNRTEEKCLQIQNCKTYNDNGICEVCEKNYRISEGNCIKCPSNCDYCLFNGVEDVCIECTTGYMLEDGICKEPSTANCDVGDPVYGCKRCMEGYYFDNEKFKCEKCDDSCKTCFGEKSNCIICSDDYYYNTTDDKCLLINKEICTKYDQFGCRECKNSGNETGYFIRNGSQVCEKCNDNCSYCEDEPNHCLACLDNLLLISVDDGDGKSHYECGPLDGTHCIKTESGYCLECEEGLFIGEDMQCIACTPGCKSCTKSDNCLMCEERHYMNESKCYHYDNISMTCDPTPSGCSGQCKVGFYAETTSQLNCSECPSSEIGCKACAFYTEFGAPRCKDCDSDEYYANEQKYCVKCSEIEHCKSCNFDGCKECESGYMVSGNKCTKNYVLIVVPTVIGAIILILIIIIIIVLIVSCIIVRKKDSEKKKPHKITSDLELTLLTADNKNFPLKTPTWNLNFNITTKAIVDEEYEQVIQIANTTSKTYFFEILATPSHRYNLTIDPQRYTLTSGQAIDVSFKMKMLCTAIVKDEIGIIAMDMNDQEKETACMSVSIESDLSLKLDHTDLEPVMPPIGEGAFGMVFRGKYRGKEVAIKKMKSRNLTPEQEREFNHEVNMLTQLRYQNVVEFIGAVYTEGEISIVTEYAEFGSLSKIWGKFEVSYPLKVKVMYDLAVALKFLHNSEFIHRDVKGENVLIFSLNPNSTVCGKLSDFGTCRSISQLSTNNKELTCGIGTPTYMPPECLLNTNNYSYPMDVYAFGIVLYETFVERNAYSDDAFVEQPWKIPQFVIEGNRPSRVEGMEDNYWNLIVKCWNQNDEERPSIIEVVQTLEEMVSNLVGSEKTSSPKLKKKKAKKSKKNKKGEESPEPQQEEVNEQVNIQEQYNEQEEQYDEQQERSNLQPEQYNEPEEQYNEQQEQYNEEQQEQYNEQQYNEEQQEQYNEEQQEQYNEEQQEQYNEEQQEQYNEEQYNEQQQEQYNEEQYNEQQEEQYNEQQEDDEEGMTLHNE